MSMSRSVEHRHYYINIQENLEDTNIYRGITLTNIVAKIYSDVI